LEGVVAARTGLSLVDGDKGELYYLGIPIQELIAHSTFEEIVYLLLFRKLPTHADRGRLFAGSIHPGPRTSWATAGNSESG
jgi:citrate synthase